ncbi:hypothetical protein [Candidatus Kuenenia stuttgartiensis]|uniref:hypothetical protein n=1 Tax=Kuenenia stuttgartiensis TaxID=174633 RepID=UPI00146BFBBE|nr:hypothetical protein [Candidatus Kuenenia stuttgartiensis]
MRAILKYSKRQIDKAGGVLSGVPDQKMNKDQAIEILENFRSLHIHPLIVFRVSLQRKSEIISGDVLISQRLKRAPSIVNN